MQTNARPNNRVVTDLLQGHSKIFQRFSLAKINIKYWLILHRVLPPRRWGVGDIFKDVFRIFTETFKNLQYLKIKHYCKLVASLIVCTCPMPVPLL